MFRNTQPFMSKFDLFKDQLKRFVEALTGYDPCIWFPPLRGGIEEGQPGNWFISFVPASWGRWKGAIYGVHFDFMYGRPRRKMTERIRLTIGVEAPLLASQRQGFKEDVISEVRAKGITLPGFELNAKARTKLLEAAPIPFGGESWQIALQRYIELKPFVGIVGSVVREYYEKGAFDVPMSFQR